MKLKRPKYFNLEPEEFPTKSDGFDVVELKYDGWWGQLVLENKVWRLYSRTGQLKKFGELKTPQPGRSIIHGEFCYGTQWAKGRQEYGKLAVYGAEELKGLDVRGQTNGHVRSMLIQMLPEIHAETSILEGVFLVDQYSIEHAPKMWEEHEDFEGLVFKDSREPWGTAFARMKRNVTAEFICMGFEKSTSDSYAGWGVKSVIGGLYDKAGKLVEVCRVGGITDTQRSAFFKNPNQFIGKVFTAEGKQLMKSGALRHPNFLIWRGDKRPEECVKP